MFDDGIQRLGGLQVIIRPALPEYHMIKRHWMERLFSRPWTPRTSHRQVPIVKNININTQPWRVGLGLSMTEKAYQLAKAEKENRSR